MTVFVANVNIFHLNWITSPQFKSLYREQKILHLGTSSHIRRETCNWDRLDKYHPKIGANRTVARQCPESGGKRNPYPALR